MMRHLHLVAGLELLTGLVSHMDDGVLVRCDCGETILHNEPFREMFGIAEGTTSSDAIVRSRLVDPDAFPVRPPHQARAARAELNLKDGRVVECECYRLTLEDNCHAGVWRFRDITARRLEEQELCQSRQRLRDLAAHLDDVRERERREIARTLHDEAGQLLTGARFESSSAIQMLQDAGDQHLFPLVDRLQAIVGLIDLAASTVQRVAASLRATAPEQVGLLQALRWEAALFERRTGIRCRVSARPPRINVPEHAGVLYRIAMEALTNVARHSRAGTAWIEIRRQASQLTLDVRDNGRGISSEALRAPESMGLLGMRERALACGGELQIARLPEGGTRVLVTIPLDQPMRPLVTRDAQNSHR